MAIFCGLKIDGVDEDERIGYDSIEGGEILALLPGAALGLGEDVAFD